MLKAVAIAVIASLMLISWPGGARALLTGSMVINDGQEVTSDRVIYINASFSNPYPISKAMLDEDPDFENAVWVAMRPSLPFQLSMGDGLKTVYAQFVDTREDISEILSDDIYLDTSPPVGTVTINGGAELTNGSHVFLNLSAEDFSSMNGMMVSNQKDFQGAQWTAFKTEAEWELLPGDGTRTVFVKFRDTYFHESLAANDSIFLDTIPPALNLTINSGGPFTARSTVTVHLEVSENYRTEQMMVTRRDSLDGLEWRPFVEDVQIDISAGEGNNTIIGKVRDAAGNEGETARASIILDTVPPLLTFEDLPVEIDDPTFVVNWSGYDSTSGISCFDIQARDGTGPWWQWQTRTDRASATFTGTPGHSYSFRGRAIDRAGNEGSYPITVTNSTYIWPRFDPVVSFTSPRMNATVTGVVWVTGVSSHPDTRRSVLKVTLSVDERVPATAVGTDSWKYRLDTSKLANGEHTLTVLSGDGERMSNETILHITVSNSQHSSLDSFFIPVVLGIVVMMVISSLALIMQRRRRCARANVSPPAPSNDGMALLLSPKAAAITELTPEDKARISAMVSEPVNARERTADEKREAEMASRENRILTALSSLSRGLPSTLWGLDMEELAARVVGAERKDSPDGDLLVRINNRWYYGDETNIGLFMQEYKNR